MTAISDSPTADGPPPVPVPADFHRWSALAALAVMVFVASACGSTAPNPTSTGGTPSSAATSSTTAPRSPGSTSNASPYAWQRSTDPALAVVLPTSAPVGASSTLSSVLAPPTVGGSWLIAGTSNGAAGTTTASVWSSPDALTWTATALPGGGLRGQAKAITDWGSRTVVVGSLGTGSRQRAAVWVSSTGSAFRPVADSGTFDVVATDRGGSGASASPPVVGAAMDTVTSGALGLFATGTVAGRFALWYSSNGSTWARVSKAEALISGSPGAVVRQMLETSAGAFAVGSILDNGATDAAVWSSDNGTDWNQVKSSASFSGDGDHLMSALSSFGTSVVAVGASRPASAWSPASWISPNGFTWGPPTESFPEATGTRPDPGGTVVADVTVSPDGLHLAAVGGGAAEQRLWTSTDGINWTEVGLPAGAAGDADWTAGRVATDGATTVVVDPDPGQARVLVDTPSGWQEVTADPAVFGTPRAVVTPSRLINDAGRLVLAVTIDQPGQALGQQQASAAILTSSDGTHWAVTASGGVFAGQTVTDLAATPEGLVAVGGGIWVSSDAISWIPASLGLPGAGQEVRAEAVTAEGTEVLVAGTVTSAPAIAWRSDGHGNFVSIGTLDRVPPAASESPAGACSSGAGAVVVGSMDVAAGSRGLIWFSAGAATQRASLGSAPPSAAEERVIGCRAVGDHLVAWGASATAEGIPEASIWTSSPGTPSSWSRRDFILAGGGSAAITDLAVRAGTWLAVTGAATQPWSETDLSELGLWRSVDAGTTWQRIDTSGAPWTSELGVSANQVAFLGTTAVVVGQVDGRLAVWTGAPAGA